MKELAEFIRNKRIERGLTQEELANKSGVGRDVIVRLENANNSIKPRPLTLGKVAKALKVKPDELLNRE